jgi:hypothetical protein
VILGSALHWICARLNLGIFRDEHFQRFNVVTLETRIDHIVHSAVVAIRSRVRTLPDETESDVLPRDLDERSATG